MTESEKSPAQLAMEALGAWNQALSELYCAVDELARQGLLQDEQGVAAAEQAVIDATRHASDEFSRYLESKRKWDRSLLQ